MEQGATPPPSAPLGAPAAPAFVLLQKGEPFRAMRPGEATPDTKTRPFRTEGYNSLLVDVVPGPSSVATSVTVLGAPTPGGPWLQEVDGQAFQSGVSTPRRFVVTGISAFAAVALTNPTDWTVWFTPFNASSQTNVSITGTTASNLAQYAGTAVGPANPVDTRQVGSIDVSDRAGRALGVVASIGAAVSVSSMPPLVSTYTLNGTSAANTAQTVTQAAAGAGIRNYLHGLTVSWSGGAPAAGTVVTVKDGATTIFEAYLAEVAATQGSKAFPLPAALRSTADTALSVTVSAAGAGVTTKVSAQGSTGA